MSDPTVRMATVADMDAMVALAVEAQAEIDRWCAYAGDEGESIGADVAEVANWESWTSIAESGEGDLVGWLLAEVDAEMGRVWWWGPFARSDDWGGIAMSLYRYLAPAVQAVAGEEELCGDGRSSLVDHFAREAGLVPDPGSVLLNRTEPDARTDPRVRELAPADHEAVMVLHEKAFPGTHTTPAALVAAQEPRLVIEVDGAVVGYVAHEIHSDNSGYIDFLAVDPAHRSAGLGSALVDHACHDLFELGVTHAHLTVREANASARALYKRVGFVEERIAVPYRRGFTLP